MSYLNHLGDRLLVIYDGHCVLCNRSVRWLLRRDSHDRLRFAPSSAPAVASLLTRIGFSVNNAAPGPGTILVVRYPDTPSEQVLCRSDAVIALLAELPRPWAKVAVLLRFVPRPLRDPAYRLVARWRYRIWGRLESCPVPSASERQKFL